VWFQWAVQGKAIALMVLFSASVSGPDPAPYTLGVFIVFALSQGGMLTRWYRRREEGWRRGLWENLLHNQTSLRLKLRLFGRPHTIVADVPYVLAQDD
jgi:hypothetical protein